MPKQLPLPPVFVIEPTSRCNMRCTMCPQDQQPVVGDMTMEILATIADQISGYSRYIQFYFVGEPTLHPQLAEMIKFLKQATAAKIEVSTNLVALQRRKNAESFLASGVDSVLCCIEGNSPISHKALRTTGNFGQACETVHQLSSIKQERGLPVQLLVKCIESTFNHNETAAFIEYWKGVPGVTPAVTWMNTWAGSMPDLARIAPRGGPNATRPRTACAEMWNKMVIRWDGTVVLCCHDWAVKTPVGHVRSASLHSIWNHVTLNRIRAEHLIGIFDGICRTCREWTITEEFLTDYGLNMEQIIRLDESFV